MDPEWNDSQPIYRQIRDRVVAMILDGLLKDGDPLPSVRTVATESRVNPLTVLKAYQQIEGESSSRSAGALACSSGPARATCCCAPSGSGSSPTNGLPSPPPSGGWA